MSINYVFSLILPDITHINIHILKTILYYAGTTYGINVYSFDPASSIKNYLKNDELGQNSGKSYPGR